MDLNLSLACNIISFLQQIGVYAAIIAVAAWAIDRMFAKSGFGDLLVNVVIGLAVVLGAVQLIVLTNAGGVISSCASYGISL